MLMAGSRFDHRCPVEGSVDQQNSDPLVMVAPADIAPASPTGSA
jgi:hypothetical protein